MKKTEVFKRFLSMVLLTAMLLSLLPAAGAESAEEWYGYVVIRNTSDNRVVNFRPRPGSTDYVAQLPEWLVLELFSTSQQGGYTWYYARNPLTKDLGYIRGDFLQEMTQEEADQWKGSQSPYFMPGAETQPEPSASVDPDATAPVLPDAGEVMGFIRLTLDKVNLRDAPNGKILTENEKDKLPIGLVLPYYNLVRNVGGYHWAQVNYDGQVVYIRSDCFSFCDMEGNLVTDNPGDVVGTLAPTGTPAPTAGVPEIPAGSYGVTTMDNVMFRKTMSTNGDFWARLPRGWVVEVLGAERKGDILWYKVSSGTPSNPERTYTGYIHSGYLTLHTGTTATNAPSGGTASSAYAVIMIDGTNMRSTPGGTSVGALTSGTIVNVFTVPAGNSANDWYYIGVPWVNEQGYLYGYVPATSLWVIPSSELDYYAPLPEAPVASPTPEPTPVFSGSGYVRLVMDNVNIRKTPNGTSLTPKESDKLKIGTVLAYTEGPIYNSGYDWVKVTSSRGITGYVRSDCYEFCDKDGNPVVVRPTATPTVQPGASAQPAQLYIRLIKDAVNLRSTPNGTSRAQLRKNTILPYYSTASASDGSLWYEVYYASLGIWGYIMSTMAVTCDAYGNEVTAPTQPTTPPAGSTGYTGYVATSLVKVFIRSAPSTAANQVAQVPDKCTLLPLTGVAIWNDPYVWYPVLYNNIRGYIRGDCVFEVAQWQLDAYNQTGVLPTPNPGLATPKPGNSDYVMILGNGQLFIRETPSTKAAMLGSYQPGQIVRFYEKKTVSNVVWYRVGVPGKSGYGWIHGSYARVLTNAEYQQYQPTVAPTSQPTAMPDPSTFSDVAFTTDDRVKIRASASMSGKELTMVYTKGTQLTYLGRYTQPTANNNYYWFNVRYQSYTGWMRGDYIRILTQDEKAVYEQTGNPDAPREATYSTLDYGDTGEAVTKLQQKLVEKGYLTPAGVTGTYDRGTENAVKAFQKDNGLTVDGIAGEQTQHKLFGTVPAGTYGGDLNTTIYPVEMVDWYTGDIQGVWRVGAVATITDVRTGISFQAQRLYGGSHADCEPLTAADTAAYCLIYGTSTAQEIADRDKEMQNWRRRPLWVTIGGRTFAASLYGTPHNFEGDMIPNNNFPGQFCVHFVNSRTHDSNVVDYDRAANGYYGHQTAIRDAYEAYWNNH